MPAEMELPKANPPDYASLRLVKAVYFFYFATVGIFTAYANVYFHNIGMSGVEIGLINMIIPLTAIFAGPLWGYLSDRFNMLRRLLILAAAGSILTMLGVWWVTSFAWLLVMVGLFSLINSPVAPLLDTLALSLLGDEQENYGRIRIWGSIGFIVTTLVLGRLIEIFGSGAIFIGYTVVMVVCLVLISLLPRRQANLHSGGERFDLAYFTRGRAWPVFFGSLFFLGVVFVGMYTFLGIHVQNLGGSQTQVGLTFSLASLTELPVMLFSGMLVRRIGSLRMLILSFLGYAVRMFLYSQAESASVILVISVMHAVTYGFYWIGSVSYTNSLAPEHMKATAHNLRMTVIYIANVVGSLLSGYLFDAIGAQGMFLVLAGFGLAGFTLLILAGREPRPASSPIPTARL